jgi:hypothetical protein
MACDTLAWPCRWACCRGEAVAGRVWHAHNSTCLCSTLSGKCVKNTHTLVITFHMSKEPKLDVRKNAASAAV